MDSLEGAQRCSKLVFPDGKCSDGKGGWQEFEKENGGGKVKVFSFQES